MEEELLELEGGTFVRRLVESPPGVDVARLFREGCEVSLYVPGITIVMSSVGFSPGRPPGYEVVGGVSVAVRGAEAWFVDTVSSNDRELLASRVVCSRWCWEESLTIDASASFEASAIGVSADFEPSGRGGDGSRGVSLLAGGRVKGRPEREECL